LFEEENNKKTQTHKVKKPIKNKMIFENLKASEKLM
jgi:hypothetical protein